MKKKSIVIVGNGMATGRLLDELLRRNHEAFAITVIGDEIHGCYNRIMLSPLLAGEMTSAAVINKPIDWYRQVGIRFVSGVRVSAIDRERRYVITEQDDIFHYDELILATGSRPATIPAENQQLQHIHSFRTLDDIDRIMASARETVANRSIFTADAQAHALVIGGGLLGLEAAYGLAQKGLLVTLIHRGGWLLNRQLDKHAGALLKHVMEQKNICFKLDNEVTRFDGKHHVCGAELSNGDYISCDLVVIATGVSANKELGLAAGLAGRRGVAVDKYMCTSDPRISAIGECVEFNGITFGLVEPIWQHCITLADRLAAQTLTPFANSPVATKLKVSGVQLFSAGVHLTLPTHRELIYTDLALNVYRKILLEDNKIVGIVLFGDIRDGQEYFEMMQRRQNVADIASLLLLGKAFYHIECESVAA